MIIYSESYGTFRTRGARLSQIDGAGKVVRSVSRKQIREVFRKTRFMVDGFVDKPYKDLWRAWAGERYLRIGCQEFVGDYAETIRKWAFKRKKKKA